MELLAIKSEDGKGVYIFENKSEKNEILKKYPGCSHRVFKDNEKKTALAWADVKEISNRAQQVVSVPVSNSLKQNKHEFIQTLADLRKLGYVYAELNLSNGQKFKLWLDDVRLFVSQYNISNRYFSSPDYGFNYYKSDGVCFNDFKQRLAQDVERLEKEKKDFDEVDMLYEAVKSLKSYSPFCRIMHKPEIIINGNLIRISNTFKSVDDDTTADILDVVINQNSLVSITPYKYCDEIKDEKYNKAIDRLITDKILDKNGNFVKIS